MCAASSPVLAGPGPEVTIDAIANAGAVVSHWYLRRASGTNVTRADLDRICNKAYTGKGALAMEPAPAMGGSGSAAVEVRSMDVKEAGRKIADRRRELRLSQLEVADRLGIPRSTYAQYEVAAVDIPLGRFLDVCEALTINPAWVVQGGPLHSDADGTLAMVARDLEALLVRVRAARS